MSENGFAIKIGPPDASGRRSVTATSCGKKVTDKFDPDDAFRRGKFRDRCISRFEWTDDAHEAIESKILAAAEAADSESMLKPATVRLCDVTPERVEWLWRGRIAIGKLTMLAGNPGLGKSLLSLDIAARISRGDAWPDLPNDKQSPSGVVLLSAEDDLNDTIRPRLDSHNADAHNVLAITGIKGADEMGDYQRGFDISRDVEQLRQAVNEVGNCRLVVIDPVSAFMGKTDSHKNAEVRSTLAPLAALAAELRVAVVAITHLRKGDGPAVYRTMGSLAFVAAARSAWLVAEDDTDRRRRLMLPIKNNLAPDIAGLAYAITSYGPDDAPVIAWEREPVTRSADDVMNGHQKRGPDQQERADAKAWLRQALADGAQPAKEILANGEEQGFAKRTIQRAFGDLRGQREKRGFSGGWLWLLPEGANEDATTCPTQETWHLRHLRQNTEEYTHTNTQKNTSRAKMPGCECVDTFPERNGFSREEDIPF